MNNNTYTEIKYDKHQNVDGGAWHAIIVAAAAAVGMTTDGFVAVVGICAAAGVAAALLSK